MRNMIPLAIGAITIALVTGCKDNPPAPDNTKANERDTPAKNEFKPKTPLDQGQSKDDVDITATIRRDLMSNDALSTNAKNVKIIASEGTVTLRGPVKSEDERAAVVNAATRAPGVRDVDNQLEIAP